MTTMTYAVICTDGTSYVVTAESPEAAIEQIADREDGTEVEDHLGIEMPQPMQMDGTGAAWLRERAEAAGLNVVEA